VGEHNLIPKKRRENRCSNVRKGENINHGRRIKLTHKTRVREETERGTQMERGTGSWEFSIDKGANEC